ncbi:hypothetical protein LBMAG47_05060 [Planctomycetia bacterium]|nr:hypothetical protein LBMAG47_05060 [Planctomycetia bacterium]
MKGLSAADRRRAAWAIARRDLLEFVRDRRTLIITLLMPMVMYPVLALSSMLGVRGALSDIDTRQSQGTLRILLVGADAEAFAARLRAIAVDPGRIGRDDWPAKLDLEVVGPNLDTAERVAALQASSADLLIEIPAAACATLDGDGTLRLVPQPAPNRAFDRIKRLHFAAVVRSIAEDARQRRMRAAGLPVTTLVPLQAEFSEPLEPPVRQATREMFPIIAGAVLMLLALLTATGAFYPAIDAIAGEKERGTVETLLIAPCGVDDIVRGKFLAVCAVTLATLLMNAVSIALTASVLLRQLPAEQRMVIGPGRLALAVAVAGGAFVGLAAVAAALSLAVTAAAKSVKEAQNTLTPVILLVSGLAGAALLPWQEAPRLLAAVPFAGQIAVAKAAVEPQRAPGLVLEMLGLSLLSSAALTWILLRATAMTLGDEDLLFRGPDTASGPLSRPPRRPRPSVLQAVACVAVGVALIWYAQGLAGDNLAVAIPVQQVVTLLAPLVAFTWWQRIAAVPTFALRLPATGGAVRSLPCLAGAALAGAGLFATGAIAFLAIRGTEASPEARHLAERLLGLFRGRSWWVGWMLIALVPAICEELFFRGFVLAGFAGDRPGRGRAVAAACGQAACFAAFHLLPERMPQTFALGLLLGWMVLRTGSLLPAIVGHCAHNSVPVLLLALADDEAVTSGAGVPPGLLRPEIVAGAAAALACGVAGFLATSRSRPEPDGDQYQAPARTANVSVGLSQGVSDR